MLRILEIYRFRNRIKNILLGFYAKLKIYLKRLETCLRYYVISANRRSPFLKLLPLSVKDRYLI